MQRNAALENEAAYSSSAAAAAAAAPSDEAWFMEAVCCHGAPPSGHL